MIHVFHNLCSLYFFLFPIHQDFLWEEIIAKTVITLVKAGEAIIRIEVEVGVHTVPKITVTVGPVGETVHVTIATEVVIVNNLGMIATEVLDGAGVDEAAIVKHLFTTKPVKQLLNHRRTFLKWQILVRV